ncbi:hypothetical protein [Polaribacter sp.]|uniref:hypothetical protein n=1 Tax=Polaribacter sp. TaxID=1920175 RepID=UPI0040489167
MAHKFFINCDEATTICDKSQYKEASIFEIFQLKLHFLFCKVCALYSKQNNFLSKLYKSKATSCKKQSVCISSKEKEEIKKQLEQLKSEVS